MMTNTTPIVTATNKEVRFYYIFKLKFNNLNTTLHVYYKIDNGECFVQHLPTYAQDALELSQIINALEYTFEFMATLENTSIDYVKQLYEEYSIDKN